MKDSFIGHEDIQQTIDSLDANKEKSLFVETRVAPHNKNTKIKSFASNSKSSVAQSVFIGEVGYRWVIFTCFILLTFSNGMQWVTLTGIADGFIKVYDRPAEVVNLFSLSYMIFFPIVFPFAAYIIDNKSIKCGVSKEYIYIYLFIILQMLCSH